MPEQAAYLAQVDYNARLARGDSADSAALIAIRAASLAVPSNLTLYFAVSLARQDGDSRPGHLAAVTNVDFVAVLGVMQPYVTHNLEGADLAPGARGRDFFGPSRRIEDTQHALDTRATII